MAEGKRLLHYSMFIAGFQGKTGEYPVVKGPKYSNARYKVPPNSARWLPMAESRVSGGTLYIHPMCFIITCQRFSLFIVTFLEIPPAIP